MCTLYRKRKGKEINMDVGKDTCLLVGQFKISGPRTVEEVEDERKGKREKKGKFFIKKGTTDASSCLME